jgi:hypothetical protein
VATGVALEQQADYFVIELVRFVTGRRTVLGLLDLRGAQGPSDPPLNFVTLLAESAMRTIVTKLKIAVVVTFNLMRRKRPALEPLDLGIAKFDSCRTSVAGGIHRVTVAPAAWCSPCQASGGPYGLRDGRTSSVLVRCTLDFCTPRQQSPGFLVSLTF